MEFASGKRRTLCVLVVASTFGILSASSAAAKSVTIGQLSTPNQSCVDATLLQPGAAGAYTVPKAGVITSWSFQDAGTINPGLKLKVARPTGTADTYKIVAEDTAGTQTPNTVNTYSAHIPVRAGNFLGIYQGGGAICATHTGNPADVFARDFDVDLPPGSRATFDNFDGTQIPVSAKVAIDCVVPNLTGKTLRGAKRSLKAASCTLGTVRPIGQTTGRVSRQYPAAGNVLAPLAPVNIRLG
jgi:hypothetical protein